MKVARRPAHESPAPRHGCRWANGIEGRPPKECESCAGWNAAQEPFRIFGNTYYVGVAGLSSVLVASDKGLILLDGGLPQSAPLIEASIRRLGFRTEDVRLIVNSHAHFDHAGGIAALQRVSGAIVAASASGARAIERGEPPADDPQYAFGKEANRFPPVKRVKVVTDGESSAGGQPRRHRAPDPWPHARQHDLDVALLRGGAMPRDRLRRQPEPGLRPGFRFTGDATHPSNADTFRRSISTVGGLPCDILLAVHPSFAGMEDKLKRRREQPAASPSWIRRRVEPTLPRRQNDSINGSRMRTKRRLCGGSPALTRV